MKALRSILSVALVALVASCGSVASETHTAPSGPDYWVLDRFRVTEYDTDVLVICRNKVMYVISDVYAGIEAQRVGYEKECA